MFRVLGALALVASLFLATTPIAAQSVAVPTPRLLTVATGFNQPTHIAHAGDGSDRLFIVQKPGTVRILADGALLATPFLDITDRVLSTGSEQGLFSIAFPPQEGEIDHFYVDYTSSPDGATVVSRFAITPEDPNRADPTSEALILTIPQPFATHNGSQIAFGPDGYLYIGTGDGGSGGDPLGNAQDGDSPLGKMLRIDVRSPAAGEPYGIPADNPFIDTDGFRPQIWALGLRNPWRFSFDRATGDLYIADVGQSAREEVNYQPSSGGGENYGWSIMEGSLCFRADTCPTEGLTLPVTEYGRDLGSSVTGGHVYRAPSPHGWQGIYFYGDFGSGRIWALERVGGDWESGVLLDTDLAIASFGEDEAGRLYVADLGGAVYLLAAGTYIPLFGGPSQDIP